MARSEEPDSSVRGIGFDTSRYEQFGPISIIIPAHNEARSLAVGLPIILDGCAPGELEILVVANGCSDDTVAVASSFGAPVRVLETDVPSKILALNLGDQAATGFPRFYIDADVEVSLASVRKVAELLRTGTYLAASPGLKVDTSHSSLLVRSFYRFWSLLPHVESDLVGRGVYAVSREGRARFTGFPENVVADDYFIRNLFERTERHSLNDVISVVKAPRSIGGLVRRRSRVVAANHLLIEQLDLEPESFLQRLRAVTNILKSDPTRSADFITYSAISLATSISRISKDSSSGLAWGRDDSR